jgi:hypothetical protein
MITVEATEHQIHLTIPTDGMLPDEINDFVVWLQVEMIARRSKLTEEDAKSLAGEVNRSWWERNQDRFLSEICE